MAAPRCRAMVWGVVGGCGLLMAAAAAVAGSGDRYLAGDAADHWHWNQRRNEAVYAGSSANQKAMRLPLKKQALQTTTELKLRTDAAAIKLSSGEVSFSIRLKKQATEHSLTLSAGEADPVLKIGTQRPAQFQGRWIRLARQKASQTINLHFKEAKYVTVAIHADQVPAAPGNDGGRHSGAGGDQSEQGSSTGGEAEGDGADDQESDDSTGSGGGLFDDLTDPGSGGSESDAADTGASEPKEGDEEPPQHANRPANPQDHEPPTPDEIEQGISDAVLDRVQRAVFEVRARPRHAPDRHPIGPASIGFLIGDGRYAVTTYRPLQHARSARAVFDGRAKPVQLELMAARPKLNLALLRVGGATDSDFKRSGLSLAEATPEARTRLWAVGRPGDPVYAISKGRMKQAVDFRALPSAYQQASRLSTSTRWLETTCRVSRANAGGPVITAEGTVVGLHTWLWKPGGDSSFALSARHLSSLRQQAGEEPLGFRAAARRHVDRELPRTTFPRLWIKRRPNTHAVLKWGALLKRNQKCQQCLGKGEVSGSRLEVNNITGPTKVEVQGGGTCPSCNGTGLAEAKVIKRLGRRFIAALVVAQEKQTPDFKRGLRMARAGLRQMAGHPASVLRPRVDAIAGGQMPEARDQAGKAVFAYGSVTQPGDWPGRESALMHLKTTHGRVVLHNPRLKAAANPRHLLFGGLFAGRVLMPTGQRLPILQAGLIASAPGHVPTFDTEDEDEGRDRPRPAGAGGRDDNRQPPGRDADRDRRPGPDADRDDHRQRRNPPSPGAQ